MQQSLLLSSSKLGSVWLWLPTGKLQVTHRSLHMKVELDPAGHPIPQPRLHPLCLPYPTGEAQVCSKPACKQSHGHCSTSSA